MNQMQVKERLLVNNLIDISSSPVVNLLDLLLQDKSTKKTLYGPLIPMKN